MELHHIEIVRQSDDRVVLKSKKGASYLQAIVEAIAFSMYEHCEGTLQFIHGGSNDITYIPTQTFWNMLYEHNQKTKKTVKLIRS